MSANSLPKQMHMKTRRVLTTALLAVLIQPGVSLAMYCSEPSTPYCLNSDFSDKYDFESCQRKMKSYLSDVEDYRECLQNESNEALNEANKAIKKFNCRASGESLCL